ncbi:ATP-binding cassette domain-containing protein [Pseudonocardia kunmingensis]|uniref:Peptide/nickel transport system ATP-binding protein n=1 Tax=Pseudonocardia kunmingensis TaxID=630975 RepID=A0A543DPU6_9PSEU|nr:ATP-binding cassette domain-containing protein [Pseudonocardia kunmingensis]TQM11361.1 peptide/nickel transport system ATP-binding protein [Pseudonocardia kunmingensis]
MALLEVDRLTKEFRRRRGEPGHRAVDEVSFRIERGGTLALVGESGAGKSTTGRLVLRLIEPDSGGVSMGGTDVRALDGRGLRAFRKRAQMVFQDPHSSLDPRVPIAVSVAEPLVVHGIGTRGERRERVADLLDGVGIGSHLLGRYPAQLSGGQLQRVAIARALATDPELIVCDEPVSALDVSIQAQVINLLTDLQAERGIAYLFITHDLALVEAFADTVAVMRAGAIVEQAPVDRLFREPEHDYTRTLLDAVPYIGAPAS